MPKFRIWNEITGFEHGTYQGISRRMALDYFAEDAGYISFDAWAENLFDPCSARKGQDDGLRIEEIEE